MPNFSRLLGLFESGKYDFYQNYQDKMSGSKIHLPIPVLIRENDFCIEALVHYLWASIYLSQPYQILHVCDEKISYFDCIDTNELQNWKGPIFDSDFELLEERVLAISERVFECYLLKLYDRTVKEYAQIFFKITPPEYVLYYQKMSGDFIVWLKKVK